MPRVAFVLKGYPRLSETFIAQEILALEQRGLDILVVSLRPPTDCHKHPIHEEISAPIIYLPEFPAREPGRVLRAWLRGRKRPGYRAARNLWLRDLRRDMCLARARGFLQSLVLFNEAPPGLDRLHAHFLHTPASVTRYAAMLLDLPWSCSAHAVDIWTTPDWEKREKLADLDWLVTCTKIGRKHLANLASDPGRVELVYHGLDFTRFPKPGGMASARDGSSEGGPAIILSVGRAVEKKGYGCLLGALARLPKHLDWRFIHIGAGALLPALKRQADLLGLQDRITWMGPQPQDKVIASYRAADIFVLANCVAPDGDMDGLPNVIMEAQSQGLACVSTQLSAIPELIEDGATGVLVPPDDADSLAGALAGLITDPGLRVELGDAGFRRVRDEFSHKRGTDLLARKFGLGLSTTRMIA